MKQCILGYSQKPIVFIHFCSSNKIKSLEIIVDHLQKKSYKFSWRKWLVLGRKEVRHQWLGGPALGSQTWVSPALFSYCLSMGCSATSNHQWVGWHKLRGKWHDLSVTLPGFWTNNNKICIAVLTPFPLGLFYILYQ